MTATLGSILVGSKDPDRLRDFYVKAFGVEPDGNGFVALGVGLLADGRDDVAAESREPGRFVHNFHVDDVDAAVARLRELGAPVVAEPDKRRDGTFATFADPDGNYVQVIEFSRAYRESSVQESAALAQHPYSGFAAPDIAALVPFYRDVLDLPVAEANGMMQIGIGEGHHVLVYPKPDHEPAGFTVLYLPVADIDEVVDRLAARGVEFLRYDGMEQDDKGVMRGLEIDLGPNTAWFTDPAGNILALSQVR